MGISRDDRFSYDPDEHLGAKADAGWVFWTVMLVLAASSLLLFWLVTG